ncbi:MAG TPA: lactonase family protein [Planctomycetota bacterium]|nr:lactonase family protein [Planctomycetota bacterium]
MLSTALRAADGNPFVYIAGYDNTVTCFEFNSATGELKELSKSDCGKNPTYMAIHPSRKFIYAANETGKGLVSAYAIDPKDGHLTKLNEVSSGGDGPCHVAVHPDGKWVFAGNYGSGHIGTAPINPDGSLGTPLEPILGGKNAHEVVVDASGKFVFVPFLGTNVVNQYKFDEATGKLTPNDPPSATASAPKAGPRHFAIHPNGKFAYSINELNCTLDSWMYDRAKGLLSDPKWISTVAEGTDLKGMSTAHVLISPDGKFIYGSNRDGTKPFTRSSVAIYSIDQGSGRLTFIAREDAGGEIKVPRDFALDPTGKFAVVANQNGGNVTVFARDEMKGTLKKIGTYAVAKGPSYVGFMAKP